MWKTIEAQRQAIHDSRERAKRKAFEKLGNVCACCGFGDWRAFQLDHKNRYKGPRWHSFRSGMGLIYALLSGKVPWEEIQLLCANCNAIKRYENKEHRH
jgi:ribosomal protein L37E